MEAHAILRHARISPRKVKIVCDLIRNQDVDSALAILKHTPKAASELLFKLVSSAASNAENNHAMDPDSLYISEVYASPGKTMKRWMPRARGSSNRILKRTSHITVVVKEREE
jgi:large subunit ribosomal protein L22